MRSRSSTFLHVLLAGACGVTALLAAPAGVCAQNGSIEGVVRSSSGPIPAATILLRNPGNDQPLRGTTTDTLGVFAFSDVPAARYEVSAERLGFITQRREITVRAGSITRADLLLVDDVIAIEGVTVSAERARERFRTEAGTTSRELSNADLKLIPGIAEADVLRAIEVLPGVVSTSDFSSAFNVRGGSADQNLILLDGLPIYNPFHLGGLFSVFNSDMVARAELLSGGFPTEYGTRVSSVLDVQTDPGRPGFTVDGGISMLAARVALGADLPESVRAPLGLRSARGRLSARRSYFDQVLKPVIDFPYHLTDLQAYGEAWTHGGARLALTAYRGADVVDFVGAEIEDFPLEFNWNWGNDAIGLRYTAPLGGSRTFDVRAGYSLFDTRIQFPEFEDTRFASRIDQFLVRADADVFTRGSLELRVGAQLDRLSYDNLAETGGAVFGQGKGRGVLAGTYAQARWRAGPWLLEGGARVDTWNPSGAAATRVHPAPRVAFKRFLSRDSAAIKLAVGRYTQYVHSLRDEELPVGIDLWVVSGDRAPIVVSDQIQAGYERFLRGGWYYALEAYYRGFDGVTTNNYADDPNDNSDDFLPGRGSSYGADLLLKKEQGAVNGWVAVSLLRATRTFPDVNSGLDPRPEITYPPIFDRRLDVELVLRYGLPRGIESGLRWSFGSGLPFTRPIAMYAITEYELIRGGRLSVGFHDDSLANGAVLLGERNAERYPAYHRLDISFRKTFEKRWGKLTPYIDVLNLYNRKNVLFYFYEFETTPPTRAGASMFPILPTLGVEVSF